MAWIKVRLKGKAIIDMPETVYENMFKGNEAFEVIEEKSEPKPTNIEKKEEIVEDVIQEPKLNEGQNTRKNTKKTSK